MNDPIAQQIKPQEPYVMEELRGVPGIEPSTMYDWLETNPSGIEARYTSRSLDCWADGTRSSKTKPNTQPISSLLEPPLQEIDGGRTRPYINHDNELYPSLQSYKPVIWIDDLDEYSSCFRDVPGYTLEHGVLQSARIREGHSHLIRLTEGSVDGGRAEPPPARGGEVARVRGSLGPWNSVPSWTTPDGTCVSFIRGCYLVTYDQNLNSTVAGRLDVFAAAAPVACAY